MRKLFLKAFSGLFVLTVIAQYFIGKYFLLPRTSENNKWQHNILEFLDKSKPEVLLNKSANNFPAWRFGLKTSNRNLTQIVIGKGEKYLEYFSNVCIFPKANSFKPGVKFKGELMSFDSKRPNVIYNLYFDTRSHQIKGSHWYIVNTPDYRPPQNAKVIENKVAFFPGYWRPGNIFLVWARIVPELYNARLFQSNLTELYDDKQLRIIDREDSVFIVDTLCPETYSNDAYAMLGFTEVLDFSKDLQEKLKTPLCYKHAIFGDVKLDAVIRKTAKEAVISQWSYRRNPCKQFYVLIVERLGTRHILNLAEIVASFKRRNVTVRVEHFEGKTLQEQAEIMHCAKTFIAVQGAAMSWFDFLPKNANLIEFYWTGWASKYKKRARKSRKDVHATAVQCKPVIPETVYKKHAEKLLNKKLDRVDEKTKKILRRKALKLGLLSCMYGSVYRDADVICPAPKSS